MWRVGFFFHEMGFGLLSIFLPLHIIAIGGSLVDIGLMSSIALFLVIPASFFWGYICDKTRRYKRYILLSFLTSTILLYAFTLTTNIGLLIALYAILSIFHVAHEPPKNILIAELYSRGEWERTYALYEGFTETGWLIGLLSGFFLTVYGFAAASTLLLCSILNFVALLASLLLVTDPSIIFERSLVNIEKTVDFSSRGIAIASKILDGLSHNEKLKRENLRAFFSGLILFSIATSILFTPLPIFFSEELALSASIVFAIYMLNSVGGTIGYFLARSRLGRAAEKSNVSKIVLFRGVLALFLVVASQRLAQSAVLATAILVLMGFAYALFLVHTLSLSMELMPAGKGGLFNVLLGIGGASGSFIGPFLAQTFGFAYVFLVSGVVFFLAYLAFRLFV
jgi:MFS family permease